MAHIFEEQLRIAAGFEGKILSIDGLITIQLAAKKEDKKEGKSVLHGRITQGAVLCWFQGLK
ncbi:MAG: hypothetical protein RLO81_06915 [Fulvivirga sp.]|uniref:hypothetical protein n=1 Tax=Fulvivirga sp. TaxID=1931237 RepID=UPI0032EED950